jgi:alkylation response protein AidB-like acyl-CoA dehydrogenase
VTPRHDQWEADGLVDRQVHVEAGEQGVLGFNVPEEYGGGGRAGRLALQRRAGRGASRAFALVPTFNLQTVVLGPYLLRQTDDEQKARRLPAFARGELIVAIGMTDPSGSWWSLEAPLGYRGAVKAAP